MFLTCIFCIFAACKHADSYYIFVPIYGIFLSLKNYSSICMKMEVCLQRSWCCDSARTPGPWSLGVVAPQQPQSPPRAALQARRILPGDLLCKWSHRLIALFIFLNCGFTYWLWRGEKVKSPLGGRVLPHAETFLIGPAGSVESQYFRNFHADLELTLL